ncbi:MAG TPA: tetratricopeptide repeat protein [Phycisphaeraceae bacterium]|nr:tetratricopeptide repeat protein [Phycisphaeraceae bacterium]
MAYLRRTTVIISLTAVAVLAGCAGTGVQGQKNRAQAAQRWSQIKSGTEWDMARQAFEVGDLDTAYKRVQQSLAYNDQVAKSHTLLGRIELEKGDLDKAIKSFKTALLLDPEDTDALYASGIAYERMSKNEEAFRAYYKAYTLNQEDAVPLVAAVETLINEGKLDKAYEISTAALDQLQHNSALHQLIGQIHMLRGEYSKAVDEFEQASLLAADNANVREDLIRAMYADGRFAECEYEIQQMLKEDDFADRRDLKHMRTTCLEKLDRLMEARDILMKLAAEDRTDFRAWSSLGQVAYKLNDFRRLRQSADRLMGLRPDDPEGYVFRALWEWKNGSHDKAMKMLDKAKTLNPDDPYLFTLLSVWLREEGKEQDSVAALQTAQRLAQLQKGNGERLSAVPGS